MTAAEALRELAMWDAPSSEAERVNRRRALLALADEVERLETIMEAGEAYVSWTMGEARETDGVSRYETLRAASPPPRRSREAARRTASYN